MGLGVLPRFGSKGVPMPAGRDEFGDLMQRLREGSDEAARELLDRYGEHILRVVRRRLNRQMRSKFDSIDFVQAVWASFFADLPQERQFDCPEALMAFLVTLAQNKVIEAVRQRLRSRKFDITREKALPAVDEDTDFGLRTREPSPSQVAVANEEWRRLLADLPAHYQRMLVLLREGHTQKDIALELGVNEKTVRRVLDRLNEEQA